MSKPRVFVSRRLVGAGVSRLQAELDAEVWLGDDPPPPDVLQREAARSDGILVNISDRVDAPLLRVSPRLRIVSQLAVGYDSIDVATATEHGVLVTNTPGVLTDATADLAFALLLAQARRIPEAEQNLRDGKWGEWAPWTLLGRDLAGKTLGIVGLGAIGAAMARRGKGFGMRILYTSRNRKPEAEAETGAEWRDLASLLSESDFVSLHTPLTEDTRYLIGAAELARMKPEAVLINTARGGIIDQEALVRALQDGRIGGAALDVFAIEPIPPGDPLLSLSNVVVSPHVGSATVETRTRMCDLAVDNLLAYFRGERPPCCVNPEVLARP